MGKLNSPSLRHPGIALVIGTVLLGHPLPAAAEDSGPAQGTATAAPAEDVHSPDISQSRFAGADLPAYIEPRAAAFAILRRTTDPFGHSQDPDAKPVERKPVVAAAAAQPTTESIVPFAEIIRQVSISAVMPGQKQFLVGTRAISEKDRFPIHYRGKDIEVEVTEVNSRQVTFRNLETDETASSVLDLLPEGMRKGGTGMTPPGMTSTSPSAPLQVGGPSNNTPLASDR